MWEAKAEYADGSRIERLFEDNPSRDSEHDIECWLVERDKAVVWYSVEWIPDN